MTVKSKACYKVTKQSFCGFDTKWGGKFFQMEIVWGLKQSKIKWCEKSNAYYQQILQEKSCNFQQHRHKK